MKQLRYFFLSLFFVAVLTCLAAGLPETSDSPGGLISRSFFKTDIREALRQIALQAGVRIVPDETVKGTISLELQEVPLEDALQMVLSSGNYTFRKMPEGFYLVGLCTIESPSFNRLSVTKYFRPNYLKAKELQSLISDFYRPYVQINDEANVITVTASEEMAGRIEEDLLKFDQAPRQIMIEALIVELTQEGKSSLGVSWGSVEKGGFSIYPPSPATGAAPKNTKNQEPSLSSELFERINALIPQGKARIKANPHVTTIEGRQAEISVGREEYYLINAGQTNNAYYTLQSVSTGVILKITPSVDEDRQITVRISPEVSEVTSRQTSRKLPVVTRRSAETSVRVKDGETIAIGGLVEEQVEQKARRGRLSKEQKEVAIFITPYLLEGDKKDAALKTRSEVDAATKETLLRRPAGQEPIKKYYLQVYKIIEQNKKLPDLETLLQGEPRELTLELTLFSTGRIHSVRVLKTSGSAFLDMLATKSIEGLSPFPAFPEEIEGSSITFVVPLRYEE